MVVAALALIAMASTSLVSTQTALLTCVVLSATNAILAIRQVGDSMRADVRADLRALRERAEGQPANESNTQPVVFSGTVHTVILQQTITAETVHIAGRAPDESPPAD